MMEFKGTKGAWKASRPPGSNGFYYVEVGSGIYAINTATCHNPIGSDEDEIEVSANANLIAAAPELLEALMEVLPHLGHYADLHVSVQKKYLKAEKAINKALK